MIKNAFLFIRVLSFFFLFALDQGARASCAVILDAVPTTLEGLENALRPTISELASLRIRIDIDKGSENIVVSALADILEANFSAKREHLLEFVKDTGLMSEEQFDQKLWLEIARIQNEGGETTNKGIELESNQNHSISDRLSEVSNTAIHGTFHFIRGGKLPGANGIVTSFLLMDAPISQYIWRRVGELIGKHLSANYHISSLEPSYFAGRPLNPVENVSFKDVQLWLQGLNELSRLGITDLESLLTGHQTGDRYELPREGQMKLAALMLTGEHLTPESPPIDRDPYRTWGWIGSKSDPLESTFEIGNKSPLRSPDGAVFWDFFGNVAIMLDLPFRGWESTPVPTFGGSYRSSYAFQQQGQTDRNSHTGLRIIRRLRE